MFSLNGTLKKKWVGRAMGNETIYWDGLNVIFSCYFVYNSLFIKKSGSVHGSPNVIFIFHDFTANSKYENFYIVCFLCSFQFLPCCVIFLSSF